MSRQDLNRLRLSERDLDFLVATAHAEAKGTYRLKQLLKEDDSFRDNFIENEKVFRRVIDEEEVFLRISPTLFFEILLRKTVKDLKEVSFTLEKTSTMKIPIFDTKEMVELLAKKSLLQYLADMLSSFTKIESYTVQFPFAEGRWRRIRFSDLDIFSLMSLSEVVEDQHKLTFYKRVADICLFILGIFPDYADREYRYPLSGQLRRRFVEGQGSARNSTRRKAEDSTRRQRNIRPPGNLHYPRSSGIFIVILKRRKTSKFYR